MNRSQHAWICHATADQHSADRLAEVLTHRGLRVGAHAADSHANTLLSRERWAAIQKSRVLLLLWSTAASQSRSVNAEWLAAFYENRFIVPCVLDVTPLPSCLQTTVFLALHRANPNNPERLISAICGAPNSANPIAHVSQPPHAVLPQSLAPLFSMQQDICASWYRRDRVSMANLQQQVDRIMATHRLISTSDSAQATLHAYHRMHTYILNHWEAIQDRCPPADPLLDEAGQRFLDSLSMLPTDPLIISALGHVLLLQRDREAAAFFMRTAIALARQHDLTYPAIHVDIATLIELEEHV